MTPRSKWGRGETPEGLLVRSAALSTHTKTQKAAPTFKEALDVKSKGAEPWNILSRVSVL